MKETIAKSKNMIMIMEWKMTLLKHSCNPEHFLDQIISSGFDIKNIKDHGVLEPIGRDSILKSASLGLYLVK
jgi:hypothetical protein